MTSRAHHHAWPKVPIQFLNAGNDRFSHSSFQQLVVAGRLGVAGEELSGGHLLRYVCNSFRPRAAEDVIGSLDPALEVLAAVSGVKEASDSVFGGLLTFPWVGRHM